MKKTVIGVIGLGQRGVTLIKSTILANEALELVAVCDVYEDRVKKTAELVSSITGRTPLATTDYREILRLVEVDAVVISSSWESHIGIAVDAMNAGKHVGLEVGGAYSIDDCLRLVHTSEVTGKNCMMLENCCYGKKELMALSMTRNGTFGEIVHCSGGYMHDLRSEIAEGVEKRHYRHRNYMYRCCENYPTHSLGPIAKILNINHGNRMLSLVSVASKSCGMHEYMLNKHPEKAGERFAQADIITTVIKCAGGETITLTLDTTLPRAYSRGLVVRGTRGGYFEDNDSVFIEGVHNKTDELEYKWKKAWGNAAGYREENPHPLWVKYGDEAAKSGHGGMDYMVMSAFAESVRMGITSPIDVYDTAAWMSISLLSEQSISLGGAPVAIPDFTNGKWMREAGHCKAEEHGEFSLD